MAIAVVPPRVRHPRTWHTRVRLPGRPSWRRVAAALLVATIMLGLIGTISTIAHLRLPTPTGAFPTGKTATVWTDPSRPEPATASTADHRHVRVVAWYPAAPGTGSPARYIADLDRISSGLVESGEVGPIEVAGLGVRHGPCLRRRRCHGELAGGPFSARPDPVAPTKPFMYLTKETQLHPTLVALFEAGGADTFRAVVPGATHDAFADPAMFRPRVLPTANAADDVTTASRGLSLAFFDHELRGAPVSVFKGLTAPTDIEIFVYPLTPRH